MCEQCSRDSAEGCGLTLLMAIACPTNPFNASEHRMTTRWCLPLARSPSAILGFGLLRTIRRYSRYVNQLSQFLVRAIRDEHRLILFATDGPDSDTINDLMGILTAEDVDAERVEILSGPPVQTTENLLHNICDADVVIASRLHGVILSHMIAVPVVAISYDRKVDVHMKEIGQSEYCLNIDEFTAETLAERLAVLRDARELESARLRRAVQLYREQADAQYDLLFGDRLSDSVESQNTDLDLTKVQL